MRRLTLLGCAFALSACATLVTDDHQSIAVKSDPPGATCIIHQGNDDLGAIASTPGTIYVGKSRHDIAIDCSRAGYYRGTAVLQPEFQTWTYGNMIYGVSLGVLVDTASGAINEYPRAVTVLMKRIPPIGERRQETERLQAEEESRHAMLRAR